MLSPKWYFFILLGIFTSKTANSDLMIVGLDEKVSFENGKMLNNPPGHDKVCVFDITDRKSPQIIASFDLMNSISGPPTNLIITPDEKMALVANPVESVEKNGTWTNVPDNKLYLIDLEGEPKHVGTVEVGKQPSGMDITSDGRILIIGNRADPSITVVQLKGKSAKVIDTVKVSAPADAVSITPDGKYALFTMRTVNTVGILHINGDRVTFNPEENIPVGIEPYNIAVSPKGDIALVNNIGITGGNDGNNDSICVIDLTAAHPHVIDWVSVGDGPEGLAISPQGNLAVSVLINGSQNAVANPNTAWAANKHGAIAILAIDGKTVKKVQEIEVGGMPEGAVFSPDGEYIYIGNFTTDDMTILRVEGSRVINIGTTFKLPGSPASMRGID